MLGIFVVIGFGLGAQFIILMILSFKAMNLDPAETCGIGGLFGLGLLGLLVTLLLQINSGIEQTSLALFLVILLILIVLKQRGLSTQSIAYVKLAKLKLPTGINRLFPLALAILFIPGLIAALSPSDALDWDSLAYHLAVPKIWLAQGHMTYIPYIHQSNFPGVVDNLFAIGLRFSEPAAKMFTVLFLAFGTLAIFGLARRRYGGNAGWWAAIAFASIPVVLWETGTAYIDVAHGLFAGLGAIYALEWAATDGEERIHWIIPALLLGFAVGSKYTGLQTLFAAALIAAFLLIRTKKTRDFPRFALIGAIALAIASPWYIRNVINTGNPVYPFLYEVFGSRNWDQTRADIYREEQQSFGVGHGETKRDWTAFPSAVLGLAYQPSRYINPAPTQGLGFPMGAIGFAVLLAGFAWPVRGRLKAQEGAILAFVGLSLVMWFALSQQSRYIITLGVPLAVLLGGATRWRGWGIVLQVATAAQAVYTFFLIRSEVTEHQLPLALTAEARDERLTEHVPFYSSAKVINQVVPKTGKIALYGEVFGYFLDVPYFWANPGHSTVIPYEKMTNGDEFAAEMKRLGFTHAYLNLRDQPRDLATRWIAAMDIQQAAVPFTNDERQRLMGDLRTKWIVLVAEAAASGKLKLVQPFRSALLMEFN